MSSETKSSEEVKEMALIFYKDNTKVANIKYTIREKKDDVYINFDRPVPLQCNISVLVDTNTPVYATIQEWDKLEKDVKGVANNRVSCRFLDDDNFLKYVNHLIDSHNKNCSPKERVSTPGPRDVYVKITRSAFACSHEDKCEKSYICCKKVMPRKYGCPITDEKGSYFYTTQENNTTPIETGLYILNSLIYINTISFRSGRGEAAVKGLNVNGSFVAGAVMGRNSGEMFTTKVTTEEDFAERVKSFDKFLETKPNWEEMEQDVATPSSDDDVDDQKQQRSKKDVKLEESKIVKKRKVIQRSSDEDDEGEQSTSSGTKKDVKPKKVASNKKAKVVAISSEEDDVEEEVVPKKTIKQQVTKAVKASSKPRKDVVKSKPSKPTPSPKKVVAKTTKIDPTKLVDDSESGQEEDDDSNAKQVESGSDSDVMD